MKKFLSILMLLFISVAIYLLLAKGCYIQRGYFAVGGEALIPILILGFGISAIFEKGR